MELLNGVSICTTFARPADLLKAVDTLIEQGKACSRNELIANALRHEVAVLERAVLEYPIWEFHMAARPQQRM